MTDGGGLVTATPGLLQGSSQGWYNWPVCCRKS